MGGRPPSGSAAHPSAPAALAEGRPVLGTRVVFTAVSQDRRVPPAQRFSPSDPAGSVASGTTDDATPAAGGTGRTTVDGAAVTIQQFVRRLPCHISNLHCRASDPSSPWAGEGPAPSPSRRREGGHCLLGRLHP